MAAPLLMIPGPTPVRADVLAALAEPVRSHTSVENAASLRRCQAILRDCTGAPAGAAVHIFAGAGTLAMEAALVNHAAPGDRIVVCSHGYFGDRFVEIAHAHGIEVTVVASEWGAVVEPDQLRRACTSGRPPALVTVTHVDTSTGALADAAGLAAAVRDLGPVLVLDGVCATGAIAEAMGGWGYDVILTGAQKALGVPPGLAILAVSERARDRRAQLGRIAAYYADLRRWEAVADDPIRYFSTHATSLIRALEVALEAVAAEGLEARFRRHREVADHLRAGMGRFGFEPMTDADALASTLSVMALPPGVDDARLRASMAEQGVVVAGCLGPFAGRGIRVGHMGTVGSAEVELTLAALEASLHAGRSDP